MATSPSLGLRNRTTGSTPAGDRPFLDKLDLKTLQKERLFQSADQSYETVVGLITIDAARVVTRHESRSDARIHHRSRPAGDHGSRSGDRGYRPSAAHEQRHGVSE